MADQIPLPTPSSPPPAPPAPPPTSPTGTLTRRTPSDVWREIEDGYINPPPLSPRRQRLQEQVTSTDTPPGFPHTPNHHWSSGERQFQSPEVAPNPPCTPLLHHPTRGEESPEKQYPQRSPSSIWRHIRSGYGPDYSSDTSSLENIGGIASKENGERLESSSHHAPSLSSQAYDLHPQSTPPDQPAHYQSVFREHLDGFPPVQARTPPGRGLITGGGAGGRRDAYYDATLGEWRVIPPIHVDTDSELEGNGEEIGDEEEGEDVEQAGKKRKKTENKLKRVVNCVVDVFKVSEDKNDEQDGSSMSEGPIEGPIFGFESIY